MFPAIPPTVSLGIAAAKIAIPVLKGIGSRIGSPRQSKLVVDARGRPTYPDKNRQTAEYTKSRREIRQERRENRNKVLK